MPRWTGSAVGPPCRDGGIGGDHRPAGTGRDGVAARPQQQPAAAHPDAVARSPTAVGDGVPLSRTRPAPAWGRIVPRRRTRSRSHPVVTLVAVEVSQSVVRVAREVDSRVHGAEAVRTPA